MFIMNATRFYLIDLTLLLIVFTSYMIIQGGKNQFLNFGNLKNTKLAENDSIKIPRINELLELERTAKREGSGIDFDSLIGCWRFVSVCKKGTNQEDFIASSMLQTFSARLDLKECQNNENALHFDLTNSIRFGLLSIKFVGTGYLKGEQPLLPFLFERIELKLGDAVLLSRVLNNIVEEKERPFFAFIAIGEHGEWLSARGKGGGLAVWSKD